MKLFKRIGEGEPYTNALIGYKHNKKVINGEVYWDWWKVGLNFFGIFLLKVEGDNPHGEVKWRVSIRFLWLLKKQHYENTRPA